MEEFPINSKSQAVNRFPTNSKNQAANTFFNLIVIYKSTGLILIKGNNQGSISLAHNLVFYTETTYIGIKYYYTRDKVVIEKNDLTYIPIAKIRGNSPIKLLTHIRFYDFVK